MTASLPCQISCSAHVGHLRSSNAACMAKFLGDSRISPCNRGVLVRHLRGGALGIRGHHDRLRGCADGAAAGRTLSGLLPEGWHLGEAGDMMSRILALCTGHEACRLSQQHAFANVHARCATWGIFGAHSSGLSPLKSPALTLYSMASSTDMSALLFSAVSTAPPYTSRGILRKICTHGGDSTSSGCPDVVRHP